MARLWAHALGKLATLVVVVVAAVVEATPLEALAPKAAAATTAIAIAIVVPRGRVPAAALVAGRAAAVAVGHRHQQLLVPLPALVASHCQGARSLQEAYTLVQMMVCGSERGLLKQQQHHTTPHYRLTRCVNTLCVMVVLTDQLRKYFSQFGKIEAAQVMYNRETRKSRGFGFVIFEDPSSVDAVLQTRMHDIDRKQVTRH